MPLLRYFLFVGGSLLALLFIANAAYPTVPLPETLTSGSDLPPIRIRSEQKLPERVVFDTSVAMPGQAAAKPVVIAQVKPPVQPQAIAPMQALAPVAPAVAAMSAKARVREAFAQLPQGDDANEPRMSDMATVVVPEPKTYYPARPPVKHKAVARPRSVRPMLTVAQQQPQPHFGGFGFQTW
jgi:hypothetical protein